MSCASRVDERTPRPTPSLGRDGHPSFGHRSSLPYVELILLETLGMYFDIIRVLIVAVPGAVAPQAFHMRRLTSAGDTYLGYHSIIYKVVLPPIPTLLDPDRHPPPKRQLSPDLPFVADLIFSFGRRTW
ncbi:hypothetical protein BV22DRAFT_784517 [Leucogyrophana mollusca]|uniref:Uncharacterized protein n=1 Tax=Leucogyrophana mollusca TaxID=85980 RepID=A0ACB8B664_9AGAM|nr:hypothetical protein BV22DRAFT_784517 [Leucogyrophana mollusca]